MLKLVQTELLWWMVVLEIQTDHSCCFWDCTYTAIWTFCCDHASHHFHGLPVAVDVICHLSYTLFHSSPFVLLDSCRMTSLLGISQLTISSLLRSMDLTFRLWQYCLYSTDLLASRKSHSAPGCCFCFGSILIFLSYFSTISSIWRSWGHSTDLGVPLNLFYFHTVHKSQGKNTEGFAISSL